MPGQARLVSPAHAGRVVTTCWAASPQVVGVLKKEAMKTQNRELEKGAEYRQLLVQVGGRMHHRLLPGLLRVDGPCPSLT